MLETWQSFYQVTGSASGAIIGLLFIVATLSAGRERSGLAQGVKLFTTPTLVHLTVVLALSCLSLVPSNEVQLARPAALCAVMGGLIYVVAVAVQLAKLPKHTHWTDVWFYGAGPVAVYLGLVLAVAAGWEGVVHAAGALGIALLLLMLLAIRNAWDLVTWLAPRQAQDSPPSPGGAN